MKNPPHPGKHARMNCIEPLGLSVSATARDLGVAWQTLNNILYGKSGISAEMSVRLEKMGWGQADGWLRLQMNYDLSLVRKRSDSIIVYPIAGTSGPSCNRSRSRAPGG